MSSQSATTYFARPRPLGGRAPRRRHPVLVLADRLSPSQGWATYGILALTLLVVGDSITAAKWVETPGLASTLLLASLAGLGLAKVRLPWFLMHIVGLALGALVVIWRVSSLVDGESTLDRLRELFERLDVWYEAAVGGGISTDLVPFVIILLTAAWLLGFFGAWFIFRWNNVWVAVVFAGIAILTNLSFLPDKFAPRFFLFTFMAMLLVVRMGVVQAHEAWRRLRIGFTPSSGWLTIHASLWFSILVLSVAAWLPLKVVVSEPLADIWRTGRTPVTRMEAVFTRLFSTLPSRKDTMGRFFGKTLPFMGKISFGGDIVAWASTEYPSYWLSQTYNFYTSQGWIASRTERIEVGPSLLPPPRIDNKKREAVEQTVQLSFASRKFLSGGGFNGVSRPATVESLDPREFVINIDDPSIDPWFPEDIQQLAQEFRAKINLPRTEPADVFVAETLPDDLVLLELREGSDGAIESVKLQRKALIAPDLVAWLFDDRLPKNGEYDMTSMVSVATGDDLREAATEYNSFISDHYLQLPPTLPQRVRDLADRIAGQEDNPLDKALAIQDYLRGPEFTYSQDIEAPPRDADGVDYFLFESKMGYSDYFGSSMTVLLRAVGVPARMAAGYAPGELDPKTGQRFIKDSDSHGWTQVYFPEYGWIDFEPTPNWPEHSRTLPEATIERIAGDFGETDPDLEDVDHLLDSTIEGFDEEGGASGGLGGLVSDTARFLLPAAIVIGSLAAVALLTRFLWNLGLGGFSTQERLYTKMGRLGFIAGIRRHPHQTPWEYALAIGQAVPAATDGARHISNAYAAVRYGRRRAHEDTQPDEEAIEELNTTWRHLRWSLIGRAVGRLAPVQPQRRQPQAR